MRTVSNKIRIMNLQDQYCKPCEVRFNSTKYCVETCNIGKELMQLKNKPFSKRRKNFLTVEEKWDIKCEQATILFEKGMEYPSIAKKLGCHISSLYRELKKRHLLSSPPRR